MIQVDLQIFYQKKHGFTSLQTIVESWAQKFFGGILQDDYKVRPYPL